MMKVLLAVLLAVLLFILVVVLALLLVVMTGPRAKHVQGGIEEAAGHHLAEALHELRKNQSSKDIVGLSRKTIKAGKENPTLPGQGGPKLKKTTKKTKPWTEYSTWEKLDADAEATKQYFSDKNDVLNSLDLDWSNVRKELGKKLYDNREWAGRINLVGGKPRIVELVPSPYKVGEGPLSKGVAAMVPAEVVRKLAMKPALFMFHTHPGEDSGSLMPSITDLAASLMGALTDRFAADLVISPYGVFLYTANAGFRNQVWESDDPELAHLATLRKIVDVVKALSGSRSWGSRWSLETFIGIVKLYNIEYVVFPTDKYVPISENYTFATGSEYDHLELLTSWIDSLELQEGNIAAAAGKKSKNR